jgi:hypothetical protein
MADDLVSDWFPASGLVAATAGRPTWTTYVPKVSYLPFPPAAEDVVIPHAPSLLFYYDTNTTPRPMLHFHVFEVMFP